LLLLLQVLDLSANELSETGVCVLAEATRNAPGLRQLRLLGNKIPFGLSTLRKLMEVRPGLGQLLGMRSAVRLAGAASFLVGVGGCGVLCL
jgi:hypothetical protein